MRKDVISTARLTSSFFSCEQDLKQIMKLLFVDSQPYSNYLKRLLTINKPDCLDDNAEYKEIVNNLSLKDLAAKGYVTSNPVIKHPEHDDIKTYINISFDEFKPSVLNNKFMTNVIEFDVICHNDVYNMKDYKVRPILIGGYIDGILRTVNNASLNAAQSSRALSGMGQYEMLGMTEHPLDEVWTLYCLMYRATHFTEDFTPVPGNK